jgi:hypothetical protein
VRERHLQKAQRRLGPDGDNASGFLPQTHQTATRPLMQMSMYKLVCPNVATVTLLGSPEAQTA